MYRAATFVAFAFLMILPNLCVAQTSEGTPQTSGEKGTPASTPSKTEAPVAAGSQKIHEVDTPTAAARTTKTGGNTNGGSN